MKEDILVSINCTTYNQESYIEQAIESFLMQKTNFKYEILINDDASTDGTTDIIKKYEKKYPDIIKPIYQQENQYSKGIKVGYEYNFKRAKGKYIALCEGDDYWTDPYKLQKQVDYMESNPSCTLCMHAVEKIDAKTRESKGFIRPHNLNKKCTTEEVILGGGGFVGTNSLLFPRKLFKNPPMWYFDSPVGDYPMQIFLTHKGYSYYIDENMSVYRTNAMNSWSERMSQEKIKNWIILNSKINSLLDQVNVDTNKKYDLVIGEVKINNDFNIALMKDDFKSMRKKEFKDLYSKLDRKTKIKKMIKYYFPQSKKIANYLRRNNNE